MSVNEDQPQVLHKWILTETDKKYYKNKTFEGIKLDTKEQVILYRAYYFKILIEAFTNSVHLRIK